MRGAELAQALLKARHRRRDARVVGRRPDLSQRSHVLAAIERRQRRRRAERLSDASGDGGARQHVRERLQVVASAAEAAHAQLQSLGRLLAAHVSRFAGVRVLVGPSFRVAVQQLAHLVDQSGRHGIAAFAERVQHGRSTSAWSAAVHLPCARQPLSGAPAQACPGRAGRTKTQTASAPTTNVPSASPVIRRRVLSRASVPRCGSAPPSTASGLRGSGESPRRTTRRSHDGTPDRRSGSRTRRAMICARRESTSGPANGRSP